MEQLPEGLDTDMQESGSNISLGQRQLLCLARVMLRRPRVVVMDEASASLDHATDDLIRACVKVRRG